MKNIVITGVSSGIGYGSAREFVRHGYRVFGSVRKMEDAERLEAELGERFRPAPVRRYGSGVGARGRAGGRGRRGRRGVGGAHQQRRHRRWRARSCYQPLEEVRMQFEVNVVGLISATQAFLPLLGAREASGRVNPAGS